jgi:drug/metabolite transporter (DMT)-like permease
LDTCVQLAWKTSVSSTPGDGSLWLTFNYAVSNPLFLLVIGLLICQFINWLIVLSHVDLSYAQPVTSLSYASVCILSVIYLHEEISPVQFLGIALVLVGVWFISQTDCVTSPKEDAL